MPALVSIITPAYNSGKFIGDTILSVQQQTFSDWEMIIVDDCSTDDTAAIAKAAAQKDPRIRYFSLERNSGAGIARNTALEKALGRYIAFLDADDLWLPKKLQKQLDFMKAHALCFTFSFYDCVDESGNSLNRRVEAPLELTYRQLFFCNFVGNLTGIYDSAYFGKIAIDAIRKRQDWMVWLTVLKKAAPAKPVPESLALYRIRQDSISASKTGLLRHNYAVYTRFHRLGRVLALAAMCGFLFTQLFIKPRYIKKIR